MNDFDSKIIKFATQKNHLKDIDKIAQFEAGYVNRVYNLNDKYVIKIEGDHDYCTGIFSHQKEIIDKLLAVGAKVPSILDCDFIEGKEYILMEKVSGQLLGGQYYKMTPKQKENTVMQIAQELKKYHSVKLKGYAISICLKDRHQNFLDAVTATSNFNKIDVNKLNNENRKIYEYIEDFFEENKHLIQEKDTSVIVHNDIHLNNILFNKDQLTSVVDWDWTCSAAPDYDLWKIINWVHTPYYFVGPELNNYYPEAMPDFIIFLKKYYPQIFQTPNLVTRFRLFYIRSFLYMIKQCQRGVILNNTIYESEYSEKIRLKFKAFYQDDWLERCLS